MQAIPTLFATVIMSRSSAALFEDCTLILLVFCDSIRRLVYDWDVTCPSSCCPSCIFPKHLVMSASPLSLRCRPWMFSGALVQVLPPRGEDFLWMRIHVVVRVSLFFLRHPPPVLIGGWCLASTILGSLWCAMWRFPLPLVLLWCC